MKFFRQGNSPPAAIMLALIASFGLSGCEGDDGAAATSQTYSGTYEFVDTEMYLSVDHEVAPKEQAYGMDGACGACGDCHLDNQIDWAALGWSGDPAAGATRPWSHPLLSKSTTTSAQLGALSFLDRSNPRP